MFCGHFNGFSNIMSPQWANNIFVSGDNSNMLIWNKILHWWSDFYDEIRMLLNDSTLINIHSSIKKKSCYCRSGQNKPCAYIFDTFIWLCLVPIIPCINNTAPKQTVKLILETWSSWTPDPVEKLTRSHQLLKFRWYIEKQ